MMKIMKEEKMGHLPAQCSSKYAFVTVSCFIVSDATAADTVLLILVQTDAANIMKIA